MELIIAMAVGAVLLAMAVPNFSTMLQRNRINSAADQLYASMAVARGEAVKRRTDIRVCPSQDSASCRNDGDWSDGWLIFHDADSSGSPSTSEIIKAVPSTSLADGMDIECETEVEDGVTFQATGAAWDSGTSGAFWICHSNSSVSSKEIAISPSGRIEHSKRVQSDCAATI